MHRKYSLNEKMMCIVSLRSLVRRAEQRRGHASRSDEPKGGKQTQLFPLDLRKISPVKHVSRLQQFPVRAEAADNRPQYEGYRDSNTKWEGNDKEFRVGYVKKPRQEGDH